jgi:hypothetical protein
MGYNTNFILFLFLFLFFWTGMNFPRFAPLAFSHNNFFIFIAHSYDSDENERELYDNKCKECI